MRKADKRARGEQRQQVYKDQTAASGLAAIKAANVARAQKQARDRQEKQHKNTRKAINAMRINKSENERLVSLLDDIYDPKDI